MPRCKEPKTLSNAQKGDLCCSARPALGAGRVCGLVLGRGQEVHREERDRSRRPILTQPFPQSRTRPSGVAGQDRKGCGAPGPLPAPSPHPPTLRTPSPREPLQELDMYLREPGRFPSPRRLKCPRQEGATASLQEDVLGPAPRQPSPASPRGPPLTRPGSRRRSQSPSTHRQEAQGAPASGRQGAVRAGAVPPSARGALRGRTDAQARSRPRSRTDAPCAPPHAHADSARRDGSAADASAGARGIPGMRSRPLSPRLRGALPGPAGHAPGHAPPTEQVGLSPGEPAGRREPRASGARRGSFPFPRPPRAAGG